MDAPLWVLKVFDVKNQFGEPLFSFTIVWPNNERPDSAETGAGAEMEFAAGMENTAGMEDGSIVNSYSDFLSLFPTKF